MSKYRANLPQLADRLFLCDGGMETTLVFLEGVELPHFASFVLLETADGRAMLRRYYERYVAIARRHGLGIVLDAATWRANPDWGAKLGYDAAGLRRINEAAVALLEALRAETETPASPVVITDVIGPRGDGYRAGTATVREAEDYHAPQVATLRATAADMVSAITMNTVAEAAGIARAARAQAMPCVVAFTVETDGRLVGGETLGDAIAAVDQESGGHPLYYMVNCAHPTHFAGALAADAPWMRRLRGIRANASAKSHAELDESTELDRGDPADLGRRYAALRRTHPGIRILGGCCGTDDGHIAAICEAVLPEAAAA